MSRSAYLRRVLCSVGAVVVLALLLVPPAVAAPRMLQNTPEPDPRGTPTIEPSPTTTPSPTITPSPTVTPSPTPMPYIELDPTQTEGNRKVKVVVRGFLWNSGGPGVTLTWDVFDEAHRLVGPFAVNPDGTFQREVTIKKDWAVPGLHRILAGDNLGYVTEATIELLEPPPTDTPTPETPTVTFTPSPTLRPVTPMVTITPIPHTPAPARTNTPVPTRTNTPIPGTPTVTPTPSTTPSPSNTPAPGTPSVTPEPTPTPERDLSETGGGWATVFLWGFVLAGLLVVFRLLRVTRLGGQG